MFNFSSYRPQIGLFFCILLVTAMLCSKFLLSVGMFGLIGLALTDPHSYQKIKTAPAHWGFIAPISVFLLVLVGGFYVTDMDYWLLQIRLKLPFLVLPIAFFCLPAFNTTQYRNLFYWLIFVIFIACLSTAYFYYRDFEEVTKRIAMGQSMNPRLLFFEPISHIRFSLLLVVATFSAFYLWRNNHYVYSTKEPYLLFAVGIFFIIALHTLAVRSGLASFYVVCLVLGVRYIFMTKRYALLFAGVVLCTVLPLAAIKYIPSLQRKITYTLEDWNMYRQGKGKNYSDAERFISIEVGLQVGNKNPLVGVSMGDVYAEIVQVYKQKYPELVIKTPHNQWVLFYAGGGIMGILAFGIAFFVPLFYQHAYRDYLFLAINLTAFMSFLVEGTLETSLGVAFYLFFLLFSLNHFNHKK